MFTAFLILLPFFKNSVLLRLDHNPIGHSIEYMQNVVSKKARSSVTISFDAETAPQWGQPCANRSEHGLCTLFLVSDVIQAINYWMTSRFQYATLTYFLSAAAEGFLLPFLGD